MATENRPIEKSGSDPAARRPTGMIALEDLDRWFDDVLPRRWLQAFSERHWPGFSELRAPFEGRWPKVDVVDQEKAVLVRAELPGVKKEDLNVTVSDHTVTINARTKQESKEEKGQYFRHETTSGQFQRSVNLPDEVDTEAAKAVFKDGLLELSLPKTASAKRKSINIE